MNDNPNIKENKMKKEKEIIKFDGREFEAVRIIHPDGRPGVKMVPVKK